MKNTIIIPFEMHLTFDDCDEADYKIPQSIADLPKGYAKNISRTLSELDEYLDGFSDGLVEGWGHPCELGYKFKSVDTDVHPIDEVEFINGRYYWLAGGRGITIGECIVSPYDSPSGKVSFWVVGDDECFYPSQFTHASLVSLKFDSESK